MSESPKNVLTERLVDYAVRTIQLVNALPDTAVARHIAGELLECGTSAGVRYEEACGAASKADFTHKLGDVLQELKASRFWLRIISRAQILPAARIEPLLQEGDALCAMVAKSIITAKTRKS